MNKSNIDWCPSINLGHNKINVDALQAASDRAERTVLRQKGWKKLWPVPQLLKASLKILLLERILIQDIVIKKHKQLRCHRKVKLSRSIVLNFVILVYRQIKVIFLMKLFG